MNKNNAKAFRKQIEFGINVGSSSLLMIFMVLCLVSFAVLSIASANADHKLTEKVIARDYAYYEACNLAEEQLAQVDQNLASIYETTSSKDEYFEKAGSEINFAIPVSNLHTLQIKLLVQYPSSLHTGFYEIQTWKLVTTGELEMDTSLKVIQ